MLIIITIHVCSKAAIRHICSYNTYSNRVATVICRVTYCIIGYAASAVRGEKVAPGACTVAVIDRSTSTARSYTFRCQRIGFLSENIAGSVICVNICLVFQHVILTYKLTEVMKRKVKSMTRRAYYIIAENV